MPGRAYSGESYVLDLIDGLLNEVGERQHRFDCLLGDPDVHGTPGARESAWTDDQLTARPARSDNPSELEPASAGTRERNPMANDRYGFLVIEESLPEGTIAQHRNPRPKADRHVRARRRRVPAVKAFFRRSAGSRQSA